MWFHHELKDNGYSAALCGIAVADTPEVRMNTFAASVPTQVYGRLTYRRLTKHRSVAKLCRQHTNGGDLPDHPDTLNLLGRGISKARCRAT